MTGKRFYRHAVSRILGIDVQKIDWLADALYLFPSRDSLGRICFEGADLIRFIWAQVRTGPAEFMDPLHSAIFKTYLAEPHVFEQGSGRDTMTAWIRRVTGFEFPPNTTRRILDEIAVDGLFVKGVNLNGCATYCYADPAWPVRARAEYFQMRELTPKMIDREARDNARLTPQIEMGDDFFVPRFLKDGPPIIIAKPEEPMNPDNPYDEKNIRSRDFTVGATIETKYTDPEKLTLTLTTSDGPETYTHFVPGNRKEDSGERLVDAISEGVNAMIREAQRDEAGHWIDDHQEAYLVIGLTGQGPDAQRWVVKAFAAPGRAETFCHQLNLWCKEHHIDPAGSDADKILDRTGTIAKHPLDPDFRIDGGTEYEIETVPLDMFDPHDD